MTLAAPQHLGDVLRAAADRHGDDEAYVEACCADVSPWSALAGPPPWAPVPDHRGAPGVMGIGAVGGGAVGVGAAGGAGGGGARVRLSFGGWDAAADGVAAELAARGVGRGDVVCLLLPSSVDYAVCYLAAARLGAVTTGVNLRLGAGERASVLARARPALTVVDGAGPPVGGVSGFGSTEQPQGSGSTPGSTGLAVLPGPVVARQDLAAVAVDAAVAAAAGRRVPAPPTPRLGGDDPVAVVWTSGSTGAPKGALFRHGALAAVAAGSDVLSAPGDRRISPIPFAHVGYMTRPWDEIVNRVTTLVLPQPWSAADAIAWMAQERATVGQGVPTQWALVLAHPDLASADLSGLRIAGTGGSRVPPELVRAMGEALGCPVVVRYTSTEASLGTGTVPGDPVEVVATTVGRPVPGVELQVVAEDGRPSPPGEVGRVRLRSGAVMAGYVATGTEVDATATAAVLDGDGWVTTGDLGHLGSDGNLRLVGRAGDMYIRGGYNVYPGEVEDVLGDHPGVRQVAVVGADDPVLGEVGVAFVVPGDAPPGLQELQDRCRAALADYKAPDRLVLVGALPVTAMGKVDKRQLRARAGAGACGREGAT